MPKSIKKIINFYKKAKDIVSKNGLLLNKLPKEMKDNKEVVLEAVRQNPYSFKFASISLKTNPEFIGNLLTEGYGDNEDFLLEVLTYNEDVMEETYQQYYDGTLDLINKDNIDFFIKAVARNFKIYEYLEKMYLDEELTYDLCYDYEIILSIFMDCGLYSSNSIALSGQHLDYDRGRKPISRTYIEAHDEIELSDIIQNDEDLIGYVHRMMRIMNCTQERDYTTILQSEALLDGVLHKNIRPSVLLDTVEESANKNLTILLLDGSEFIVKNWCNPNMIDLISEELGEDVGFTLLHSDLENEITDVMSAQIRLLLEDEPTLQLFFDDK